MSDKLPGFVGRSIDDVQARCFLRDLPKCGGRYQYPKMGLNADPGTIVLFQYRARIIASGVFLRDDGKSLYFDVASFRTFDPFDVEQMRKVWPSFRAFGHVKQFLNPTLYSKFERSLRNVSSPSARSSRPPKAKASRSANKPTARKRSR